jgi:hypothetical protein
MELILMVLERPMGNGTGGVIICILGLIMELILMVLERPMGYGTGGVIICILIVRNPYILARAYVYL